MTFLEIVQRTCAESGVTPGGESLATVTGAAGRIGKAVGWVRDAWIDIQSERTDWLWMRDQFLGQTIAGIRAYNGAGMGITRFGAWGYGPGHGRIEGFSTYDPTRGVATEGDLPCIPWLDFRRSYLVGAPSTKTGGPPQVIAVGGDGRIWVYPRADGAYYIRGEYRKSPQTLVEDADVPEMPARHHRLIVWRALILMGVHDEATQQDPAWRYNAETMTMALVREQTPAVEFCGPLA